MRIIEPTSDLNPSERKVFDKLQETFLPNVGVHSILLPKYYLFMNNKRDCEVVGFISAKHNESWKAKDGKVAFNLFILFEVKSHNVFELRQNNQVVVKYPGGTSDAFAQTDLSARKLNEHLRANGMENAWVYSFLCFPNISTNRDDMGVEYRNHHASKFILLNEELNFNTIIQKCSEQRKAMKSSSLYFSSYVDKTSTPFQYNSKILTILSGISKPVEIGKFDKKRLEGISQEKIKIDSYLTDLDDNNLILTGKAGSGKTIVLLKLAISQVQYFKHVLILTYNTALASDINRLVDYYFEHYNPGIVSHREHLKIVVLHKNGYYFVT